MTDLELKKYKDKLLSLLKVIIDICNENNLSYYCACGTVLGAIRHKGYIPWDDDIDLYMPQEDYYMFLQICNNYDGYGTVSIHNSEQFATFAKFYDKNTTLWELKQIPFVYGIFIDIFPLFSTADNDSKFFSKYQTLRNLQIQYQMSLFSPSLSDIILWLWNKDKKMIIKNILSLFMPSCLSPKFRNKIINFEKEAFETGNEGCFYAAYYGDYWRKEKFRKEWFDGFVEVPFENLSVRVCKGYEEYLKHLYGDYMKLPPAKKQVSHHYHYFLDLDKGMTLEEIKEKLK